MGSQQCDLYHPAHTLKKSKQIRSCRLIPSNARTQCFFKNTIMDYQKSLNQKTLNRKNYKQNRSLRANKTLKQLVILAIKSSNQEGLYFNQIKSALKNGISIQCSNFILKIALQQLLSSKHIYKTNQIYKLTTKKFNRKKKVTKSRLSRKTRKQVLKQAKSARTAMKLTVGSLLEQKYKVLERVVMKAMRALKRNADKNRSRKGFVFNQIKAEVKRFVRGKKIRNVVLIKALQNLRNKGEICLKKGRNYLVKKSIKGKSSDISKTRKRGRKIVRKAKRKATRKVNRKANRKVKNKTKSKRSPTSNRKTLFCSSFADDILTEAQRESIKELKETTSDN